MQDNKLGLDKDVIDKIAIEIKKIDDLIMCFIHDKVQCEIHISKTELSIKDLEDRRIHLQAIIKSYPNRVTQHRSLHITDRIEHIGT